MELSETEFYFILSKAKFEVMDSSTRQGYFGAEAFADGTEPSYAEVKMPNGDEYAVIVDAVGISVHDETGASWSLIDGNVEQITGGLDD